MMSNTEGQTDKGYSWVILCASFFNLILISGTNRTFGILYAELLHTYGKGAGDTALIGSLMIFVNALIGLATGIISVNYSFKWCTVVGGLFAGMGMISSAFTSNVEMLFLTYSCILGIGLGLSQSPTTTIVNFYFEKKRAFANGFLTASIGLSSLVYPVLYRKLIAHYGIHGAMLILGGILLNICVGGSFFRQPRCFIRSSGKNIIKSCDMIPSNRKQNIDKCSRIKDKVMDTLHSYKTALRNKSFILYSIAISFALVGYSSNFNILPTYIESQNFTKDDAVIVISVIGGIEFVSRFISGLLLDLNRFTVQTMFIVTMFAGGLCAIALMFFRNMIVNIIYAVTIGIFPGGLHFLMPLLLVSILGLKALPSVYPLLKLISNFVFLIGYPLLGWIADLTGSWKATFYTVGGLLIMSSILVLVERKLWSSGQSNKNVKAREEKDGHRGDFNKCEKTETSAMIQEDCT